MNILIVEDDKLLQQALDAKFSDAGARCTISSNGREAIEALEKEKFDAIILDIIMPEVDGFQVLEEKQTSLNADTPTFVVSNLDAEADYQKAIDLGATKCFLKARVTLKGLVEEIVEELDK